MACKDRSKDAVHRARFAVENGFCESFNSKLRDEFLNGEIFYSMKELRVLAERWRFQYNTIRPHASLGYRSPAPEAWLASTAWPQGEPVASLPAPLAATSCIDLTSEIVCATLTHPTAQKIGHSTNIHGLMHSAAPPRRMLFACESLEC